MLFVAPNADEKSLSWLGSLFARDEIANAERIDILAGRAAIAAAIAQLIVIAGIAYTAYFGLHSYVDVELLGIVLGLAGASFSVALPQASKWYPPQYQGIVMGIAGAGNVGAALDALIIPSIAEKYGWQMGIASLLVPLIPTLIFYVLVSKEAPAPRNPVTWAKYKSVLTDVDSLWFMFFYFITFARCRSTSPSSIMSQASRPV